MWALSGTGRDSVTGNRSTKTAGDVMRANGNATPRHRHARAPCPGAWPWGGGGVGEGEVPRATRQRRGAAPRAHQRRLLLRKMPRQLHPSTPRE